MSCRERIVRKAPAAAILICAAFSGHVFTMTGARGASLLESSIAPYADWRIVTVAGAIGSVHAAVTRRHATSLGGLALATAICMPVAFAFGMLDAGLFLAQSGCIRPSFALALIPALLAVLESVCRRVDVHLARSRRSSIRARAAATPSARAS